MKATLISFDRRGLRRSSLALLGAVTLAACDDERPLPLGPNPTSAPTEASLAKGVKGGTLIITMVDQNQSTVGTLGGQFTLAKTGQPTYFGVDNGPGDGDAATGVIQRNGLVGGAYTVCQTVAPTDYVMANPACQSVLVIAGGVAQLQFVNVTMARATFRTIDYAFNYIGGAEFKLRDSTAAVIAQFVDNTGPDLDPNPGRFDLKFAVEGTYSICPVTPPPGYLFPFPAGCVGFQVTHGKESPMPEFWVYPPYSAYWHVTDGTWTPDFYAVLIGPSTFEVTGNAYTATIVDNGANDFDTRLGRLAINLPDEGWYTVCQTVPPINHQNATPSCKRIEVKKAVPGWGEFFFNYPI